MKAKKTTDARTINNPLFNDRVTFLETAAETGGKRTRMLLELGPKGGNDMHCHKSFDEVFTVLQGQLGVRLGNGTFLLQPGETVRVKAGDFHCFFNPSDTETVVAEVLLDNGNSGMEKSLQVVYGLARDGKTTKRGMPTSLYHLAVLAHWSDSDIPGWITRIFEPVIRWLHREAVRKGIDQQLIRQYVTV